MSARQTAEAVARRSYGRLVALLTLRSRDPAAAEDALSEAFAEALQDWPRALPAKPEAWLLTVARRRLIDAARHREVGAAAQQQLLILGELSSAPPPEQPALPDPRLGLLFACAHPAIAAEAHAPLMLQLVLGFDVATMAASFLLAPATLSQRLVRAKAKLRKAGIAFELPEASELPARLDTVLDAVYACYAEAWTDAAGLDARWRNLREEALWLARLLAGLLPAQAEAQGLLALMLYCEARQGARRSAAGDYVPLTEQDPRRWDHPLIEEAELLLRRASRLPSPTGRFQLEAALQSAHTMGRLRGTVDRAAIVGLYALLLRLSASPVVAINHAVALAELSGAPAGLAALEALAADARLQDYQPFWAARAELLARCGRAAEAATAYQRAMGLERDPAVRRLLQQRGEAQRLLGRR